MKKIISIVMSVIMMIAALSVCTTAFAEKVNSVETTAKSVTVTVTLNGQDSPDTEYKTDKNDPGVITFTYTGGGELIGWEFPNAVEGVDYVIVSRDGDSITVKIINYDKNDNFWANAIDKYGKTTEKVSVKKDESHKSPKTGAVSALGFVAAGCGLLVIAKKKF